MKKRGIVNQVFVYIFVAIVIALVVLFGFNQIWGILRISEKAKYVDFKLNLEKSAESIFVKSPGSLVEYSKMSSKKPLVLPKSIKKVCFKNKDKELDVNELNKLKEDERNILKRIDKNVILLPLDYDAFDIKGLKTSKNPICFNTLNEKISFILESKFVDDENYVEIREVS